MIYTETDFNKPCALGWLRISFTYRLLPEIKLLFFPRLLQYSCMQEKEEAMTMAKLIAFYSRADENYFGGTYRYIEVGNTEKAAEWEAVCGI